MLQPTSSTSTSTSASDKKKRKRDDSFLDVAEQTDSSRSDRASGKTTKTSGNSGGAHEGGDVFDVHTSNTGTQAVDRRARNEVTTPRMSPENRNPSEAPHLESDTQDPIHITSASPPSHATEPVIILPSKTQPQAPSNPTPRNCKRQRDPPPPNARETSPDELHAEDVTSIGLPKENYKPRPSRSRSTRLSSEAGSKSSGGEKEYLVNMGFCSSQVDGALRECGGSLGAAEESLISKTKVDSKGTQKGKKSKRSKKKKKKKNVKNATTERKGDGDADTKKESRAQSLLSETSTISVIKPIVIEDGDDDEDAPPLSRTPKAKTLKSKKAEPKGRGRPKKKSQPAVEEGESTTAQAHETAAQDEHEPSQHDDVNEPAIAAADDTAAPEQPTQVASAEPAETLSTQETKKKSNNKNNKKGRGRPPENNDNQHAPDQAPPPPLYQDSTHQDDNPDDVKHDKAEGDKEKIDDPTNATDNKENIPNNADEARANAKIDDASTATNLKSSTCAAKASPLMEGKGRKPYRVGLSRRLRIEPLLKVKGR